MIVLDTNVMSEAIRGNPDVGVVDWLVRQPDLATTSVTVGELLVGVGAMPAGRRRDGLSAAIDLALTDFRGRILGYDEFAAREYAAIRADCRRRGQGIGAEDGMIAGIVRSTGATLATRNVRDFADLGIDIIDPWNL